MNDESIEQKVQSNRYHIISSKDQLARSKLFIGGLSIKVTEEKLGEYFSHFGRVNKLTIIKTKGVSKGFGFVLFESPISAQNAVATTHYLEGKSFNCKYILSEHQAKNQMMDQKMRKLFVKGLPISATQGDLESYFSNFGRVERAIINKYVNDASKGTGFVLFDSEKPVSLLLDQPDNKHYIGGKEVKIYECLTRKEINLYAEVKESFGAHQPVKIPVAHRKETDKRMKKNQFLHPESNESISKHNYPHHHHQFIPKNLSKVFSYQDGTQKANKTGNSIHNISVSKHGLYKFFPLDSHATFEDDDDDSSLYCCLCKRLKKQPPNKPRIFKDPQENSQLCHECYFNECERVKNFSLASNLVIRINLGYDDRGVTDYKR